jgi:chemotaxis protein CheD
MGKTFCVMREEKRVMSKEKKDISHKSSSHDTCRMTHDASYEIGIGEMAIYNGLSQESTTWTVSAIGSCLVIFLYEPVSRRAAIAHTLLAERSVVRRASCVVRKEENTSRNTQYAQHMTHDVLYVDRAIDILISEMENIGSQKKNLEATIVGGANMFPDLMDASSDIGNIGKRNIAMVRKKLSQAGIPIVKELVGGNRGRTVVVKPALGEILEKK